ncbi:MAG: DUF4395 domain-containing protein [Gammaproteobacteria bacterium]|nr:DUF4395 domain-containing protein [Gammaproteobacteria bacterium]MBU1724800.1 DUF4395 domain-containing protein [Gammaproteobacteria bacterium]MBU2006537.1 DUF4395 domain-containing protein [Gammaproteobacteria bacterium]
MGKLFSFGETLADYSVPVLNEREVRAAAGILFLFALVAFMNAWLLGNFHWTRLFVVAFLTDFSIRLLVNPAFAPSMVLGRFMVRNQTPEYVGAPQKRFAWLIGFALALPMLYLIVINHVIGPLNLAICLACLTLMFFESAFGICLGCKVYNLFFREKAKLCPGDACEANTRHDIQRIGVAQMGVLATFIALIILVSPRLSPSAPAAAAVEPPPHAATSDECTPPDWAVQMGHADMWKLHHNCP